MKSHVRMVLSMALVVSVLGCGGGSKKPDIDDPLAALREAGGLEPGGVPTGIEMPTDLPADMDVSAAGGATAGPNNSIEGTWSAEVEMNNSPIQQLSSSKLGFKRGRVVRIGVIANTPQGPGVDEKKSEQGIYRIDNGASPKAIDIVFPTGRIYGIVEVDGNTARLAYSLTGGRPRSFDTKGGSNIFISYKLTRGSEGP